MLFLICYCKNYFNYFLKLDLTTTLRVGLGIENRYQISKNRGFVKIRSFGFCLSVPNFFHVLVAFTIVLQWAWKCLLSARICYADLTSRHLLRSTSTNHEEESFCFQSWTMADRSKHSKVWLSFTKKKKENDAAKYNTCSKEVWCAGGSSANMTNRLLQHWRESEERRVINVSRFLSCNDAPDTANPNRSNSSGTKHRWAEIHLLYWRASQQRLKITGFDK